MSKEERARLDALAKSLVSGLAIAVTVTYHADMERVYVDCRSLGDASCGREPKDVGTFTSADHPNIEQFVREQVESFVQQSGPWKQRSESA
jgi:hypothetical protein